MRSPARRESSGGSRVVAWCWRTAAIPYDAALANENKTMETTPRPTWWWKIPSAARATDALTVSAPTGGGIDLRVLTGPFRVSGHVGQCLALGSQTRAAWDAERDVRHATDRDRKPEVHQAPAEHRQGRDVARHAEGHEQRRRRRFDDPEPTGRDGDGAQHVGDAVGRKELDGVDEVPEGGDERRQRGGVEEPVEPRPQHRPLQNLAVLGELHHGVTDLPDEALQAIRAHPGIRRPTDRTMRTATSRPESARTPTLPHR